MISDYHIAIPSTLHQLPILLSLCYEHKDVKKPLIIFSHGFKGFKDWGYFPLSAHWFAQKGFAHIRFNYSHNGTSYEHPCEFDRLDNFGNNNFSIELNDLDDVINWAEENSHKYNFDLDNIYLIGHSRGGGISIIKANEDKRIKKLITWGSVADFESRMVVDGFDEWKKKKVTYIPNSRTNQQMPLYFQFYEDYKSNEKRLIIKKAAKNLKIPYLIIHGIYDETVAVNEANALHHWTKNSRLCLLENADHTFNATHPYNANTLSDLLVKKLNICFDFFTDKQL